MSSKLNNHPPPLECLFDLGRQDAWTRKMKKRSVSTQPWMCSSCSRRRASGTSTVFT